MLDEQIRDLPRAFLRELLIEKLTAQGVEIEAAQLEGLVEHVLSGKDGQFSWDSLQDKPIKISFGDEDLARLKRVEENISVAIPEVILASTSGVMNSLTEGWPEEFAQQEEETISFRKRLASRWGEAFSLLQMLLTVAREVGSDRKDPDGIVSRAGKAKTRYVLRQLHARACQVVDEILCLMRGGFADGAMARWRTLHEIGVVAQVVRDAGEDVASRYLDHEAVEANKALQEYEKCHVALGYEAPSDAMRKLVAKRYAEAISAHGDTFKADYGWAAHHLGISKPSFRDLEAAAERSPLRSHYKMASQQVHASVKGILFRLSAPNGEALLSGPSDAGFVDPCQNAAITLVQITVALLFDHEPNLDDVVVGEVMLKIQNKIIAALVEVDSKAA